jgi:hypothetical protein
MNPPYDTQAETLSGFHFDTLYYPRTQAASVMDFHRQALQDEGWTINETSRNRTLATRNSTSGICEEVFQATGHAQSDGTVFSYTLYRSSTCPTFQPLTGQE